MRVRMRLRHWTCVHMLVVLIMTMEVFMHDLLMQVQMAVPLGEEQYDSGRHQRRPQQFGGLRHFA